MCTNFLLTAADNSVVNGRSMEYGNSLGSQILVGGRQTTKQSSAPGAPGGGLSWTAQYGYVGLNAAALGMAHMITDGMNEKGLAVGGLWLPGYTAYNATVTSNSEALSVADVASWALGNFATVADVQAGLTAGVQIWGSALDQTDLPLHYAIHDATGASAVLEFLPGNTQGLWQTNPVSVLTNAPPFSWHLDNIGNFVGLNANDAAPITIGNTPYGPPGQGSGMRGLPADSTPPSRFIRILFEKQFALAPQTSAGATSLALHLLNTVDIPQGTSVPPTSSQGDDYTQWVVVKALTDGTFSYRTADNPTLMQITLAELNLSTAGEVAYPMPTEPSFIDVTSQLASAA